MPPTTCVGSGRLPPPTLQSPRATDYTYLEACKFSNGGKTAGIARTLMIFGSNRSQRHNLFVEKLSSERASEQTKNEERAIERSITMDIEELALQRPHYSVIAKPTACPNRPTEEPEPTESGSCANMALKTSAVVWPSKGT